MAIKLDMTKAYDRIEWSYLISIMRRMGFSELWLTWALQCISTISYSVNFNGEKVGFIRPTKDIKQRDPLSPHLLVLCIEGLSNLLK